MKTKHVMATDMLYQKLVDISVIGESKLDDSFSDAMFNVDGYRLFRNDRTNRGGGIMVYVNRNIPSRRLKESEPDGAEAINVELQIGEKTKWLLMANYRPPSEHPTHFLDNATKALDVAFRKFQNVMLIGDLNFNMLSKDKSAPLTELCDIFDLRNLIKKATCFTKNNDPSLVDVILTNRPRTFNTTLVCDTGLSDNHRLVACVMKNTLKPRPKGKVLYRSYKNLHEAELIRDIEYAPLHVAELFDDIDDSCWMQEKLLSDIIDDHIPLKERKQRPAKAPYMNGELPNQLQEKTSTNLRKLTNTSKLGQFQNSTQQSDLHETSRNQRSLLRKMRWRTTVQGLLAHHQAFPR